MRSSEVWVMCWASLSREKKPTCSSNTWIRMGTDTWPTVNFQPKSISRNIRSAPIVTWSPSSISLSASWPSGTCNRAKRGAKSKRKLCLMTRMVTNSSNTMSLKNFWWSWNLPWTSATVCWCIRTRLKRAKTSRMEQSRSKVWLTWSSNLRLAGTEWWSLASGSRTRRIKDPSFPRRDDKFSFYLINFK